jgi:hypothetical protein
MELTADELLHFAMGFLRNKEVAEEIVSDVSLASESRNFKTPSESYIFVSTKKLKYYGTLQAQQK